MIKYVAFLRGINVGGHRLIKMAALKEMFESMGFKNVKTYIQSGNVIFESKEKKDVLTNKIEKYLYKILGYEVIIILRTVPEIEELLRFNPFKDIKPEDKFYIVFLKEKPDKKHIILVESLSTDFETFKIRNREVFVLIHSNTGNSLFSNNLLEKKLGMAATTRNWNTVNTIWEYLSGTI